MAAQATENAAHPTPPYSEPYSENEHDDQKSNQKSDQKNEHKSNRQPPKSKTETEEKIEKETPPLRSDASTSEIDGAQHDSNKHVARRSKRTAIAQGGGQNSSREAYQSQNGQVAPQNQQVQSKGKGAPSVRLDMDLDVDIDLKAKIKGDIELSIL
ncbi:hypothetical protein ColLi_12820 [Colletotrichum liriopes]|uniref:Uncharacterized protein n=1 Tax=Colletotrichum liriopes TaxID=708192 RepID=A0AA37LZ01_9PEZI|nr:hypothetical protein ColLi_12820 [Colletotrichum liriopes]